MISFRRRPDLPDQIIGQLTHIQHALTQIDAELQQHVCPNIEALTTALADLAGTVNRIENAQQLMLGRLDRFEAYMLRVDPRYPRSHDDMTAAERAVGQED